MTFIPPGDLLTRAEEIDHGLRRYQKLGRYGWLVAVGSVAVQLTLLAAQSEFWKGLRQIAWSWPPWESLRQLYAILPGPSEILLALAIGSATAAIWVRLRLRDARQPFRYTCSIAAFTPVGSAKPVREFEWLAADLMLKLSERVGRLRFLDEKTIENRKAASEEPHIHISGTYLVRGNRVEITPRIRIGSLDDPDTLAHCIECELASLAEKNTAGEEASASRVEYEKEQIPERVYFSVATELYRQIQKDIRGKIDLLPTKHLRALALYFEAEGYARSNTLDGYDNAARLYEESYTLLDGSLRSPSQIFPRLDDFRERAARRYHKAKRWLSHISPALARSELLCARAEIGYANMLLYGRLLAQISGQRVQTIFEAKDISEDALQRIVEISAATPDRKDCLFDAHLACALTSVEMGDLSAARDTLNAAQRLNPNKAEQDSGFLFIRACCEFNLVSAIEDLRRAVDLDPHFQVARQLLAQKSEEFWRERSNFETERAGPVLKNFEELIRTNPGNVDAWASRGYLQWLLGKTAQAKFDYGQGRGFKLIKPATSICRVNYGLARIAAEENRLGEAHTLFVEGLLEELALSASHNASVSLYRPVRMNHALIARVEAFKEKVGGYRQSAIRTPGSPVSRQTADTVYAFVLNDFGEACWNMYLRTGDPGYETKARAAFEESSELYPAFPIPSSNLAILLSDEERARECVRKAAELAPSWLEGQLQWLTRVLQMTRSAMEAASQARARRRDLVLELKEKRDSLKSAAKAQASCEKPEKPAVSKRQYQKPPQEEGARGQNQRGQPAPAYPDLSQGAAPSGEVAELQNSIAALRSQIKIAKEEIRDKDRLAKELWKSAPGIAKRLLPHEWMWRPAADGESRIDLSLPGKRDRRSMYRWKRELTDIHVAALVAWVTGLRSLPAEHRERLGIEAPNLDQSLHFLCENFWPSDFELLRTLSRSALAESGVYQKKVAGLIEGWLAENPAAFWALTWVSGAPLDQEQKERLYRRAREHGDEHVVRYAGEQLEHLAAEAALEKWQSKKPAQALRELDRIQVGDSTPWDRTVRYFVGQISKKPADARAFERLHHWLAEREKEHHQAGRMAAWEDVRSARFTLRRAALRSSGKDASVGVFAESSLLGVASLALEVHGSLKANRLSVQVKLRMQEVEREFGFKISPSPAPRVIESVPEHHYVIGLNRNPMAYDRVWPDSKFCPHFRAIESLVPERIRRVPFSFNPLTGETDGAWIADESAKEIEPMGVELWTWEEYVARRLEFVVRRNLAVLLRFQDVDRLLRAFHKTEETKLRVDLLDPGPEAFQSRLGFFRVLQSLLRERVTIGNLSGIIQVFGETWKPGCDLTPIVEAIRLRERESLARNGNRTRFLRLSGRFEATLRTCIREDDGKRVFAAPPETRDDLLAAVAQQINSADGWRTGVVTDVRPQAARLIETEFPQVMVLASGEMPDELRSCIRGEIG
ncbi:MAG: FHIPEP family type III secretion protein [Bryobacteraceae bacterium]